MTQPVKLGSSADVLIEERDWSLRVAVLELTNRCNLRCAHCASGSGLPRDGELSKSEWGVVLRDLVSLGCEEVALLGGEVFLNPDWFEIACDAVDLGLRLMLITNGLLVDERRLGELRRLGIEVLGISLDGSSAASYRVVRGVDGFDRVWSLLRRVRDAGHIPVVAITTVSKLNVDQVEPLLEMMGRAGLEWQVQFASTGASRFDRELFVSQKQFGRVCLRLGEAMLTAGRSNFIVTMDDFGYFPVDARHELLHHEWTGCQAGCSVVGIRANGDVLGCLSLGDAFVEANLRELRLPDLWPSPTSFTALRTRLGSSLTGFCATCVMAPRCGAGCAAMAMSSTGTLTENTHCLRRIEMEQILAELTDG